MADSSKYYVLRGDKTLAESMTKEQILAAITQAVEGHSIVDVDTGFVTKIKESNRNKQLAIWAGTEAEFNAIETKDQNTLYIKTDDSTVEAIEEALTEYNQRLDELRDSIFFNIGDTGTLTWHGAGYLTSNNGKIRFTVPLPKFMPSGLRCVLFDPASDTGHSYDVQIRQNGQYLVGSTTSVASWSSDYTTVETSGNSVIFEMWRDGGLDFGGTNNDTVGVYVQFQYWIDEGV